MKSRLPSVRHRPRRSHNHLRRQSPYQLDDDGHGLQRRFDLALGRRREDLEQGQIKGVDYIGPYSTSGPWAAAPSTSLPVGHVGNSQAIYRSTDRAESWEKLCDAPAKDDDIYMQSIVPSPDGSFT
jgi:hypothetical protein